MIAFLILVWDGLLLIGEGTGLDNRRAEQFADVAWIGLALIVVAWAISMAWVGVQL